MAGLLKRAMLVTAGVAFGMALVVGTGFWRARRTAVAEPPPAAPSRDAPPAVPAASTPSSYPAPAVQG